MVQQMMDLAAQNRPAAVRWHNLKLSDLAIGDTQFIINEAIANTPDAELVRAYAATNRLIAYITRDSQKDTKELDHYYVKRNLMETALIIRLRGAGK